MLTGAHVVLYSVDAVADRAFFRDVLKFPYEDASQGWPLFALPPTEMGIHPDEANGRHELFLMCDDIEEFCTQMSSQGVATTPIRTEPWGWVIRLDLPSGATLGVYQPNHPSPLTAT